MTSEGQLKIVDEVIILTMEQWKTVVYDGVVYSNYEVSNMGVIRNEKGHLMKQTKMKNGYLQVLLKNRLNGKSRMLLVHRVVAFTFIPNDNPTEKTQINHIDENKENNMVQNLEWCTRQYNIDYSQAKKVMCIETGIVYDSAKHASMQTGVSKHSIAGCCTGRRKTSGGLHWKYVDNN